VLIDTIQKTVTFTYGETLTVDHLWTLVDLLDHENIEISLKEVPEVKDEPQFEKTYDVQSDRQPGLYYVVVEFPNGTWACSCPDWIHRHSSTGTHCKHIDRIALTGLSGWPAWSHWMS
jgi:hypothetical protein